AYNSVTDAKPWVKMSAAVIGKYRGTGWTAYHAVYQDPRTWMELGKIDFIVPMVYWQREHPTHPFVPLVTEWQDRVAYDRHVLPGLSAGLQERFGWKELSAEIDAVRQRGLPGVVFFSAAGLRRAWEILGVEEFPYWANTPRLAWKDSIPPPPPVNVQALRSGAAVVLQWEAPAVEEPLLYNVYRSPMPTFSREDVADLLFVTGRNATQFIDTAPLKGAVYYAVSALDRLGNESVLSNVVRLEQLAVGTDTQVRSPAARINTSAKNL
ncbi:MAG: family 10 glycosylhydrolase, partial [Bacteroidota bacterium]